jgi:CHAT domain-containing protein
LIRRNPIVYCYSLSVLRNNFLKSSAFKERGSPISPKEVALFGDILEDKESGISLPAGRRAVQELGDWFGVTPFLDARATKPAFLKVAPKSSLIHFHTHVGSLDANPLEHSISLSPDTAPIPALMPDTIRRHPWSNLMFPNSSYSEYASTLNNKSITAGEISNLVNLPSPCHVTLIACGGGRLRVHPGDEVMGLIPAFMMKGATSVIATLWNIEDSNGADFTKEFYKSLMVEADNLKNNEGGTSLVNMAKAFQAAIIAIAEDSDLPPYYWAGFVLHGWWMYKPPLITDAEHPWTMVDA